MRRPSLRAVLPQTPKPLARQRAEDPSVDHDNPLAEVYEDQLMAADLIVLNKTDLIDSETSEQAQSVRWQPSCLAR